MHQTNKVLSLLQSDHLSSLPLREVDDHVFDKIKDDLGDLLDREINADFTEREWRGEPVSRETFSRAVKLGAYDYLLPETEGGFVHWVLTLKALGYLCDSQVWIRRCSQINTLNVLLREFVSEEHKEKYVTPTLEGERFSTVALWDDADYMQLNTTVEKKGDHWVINGWKGIVTGGMQGDHVILFARDVDSDDVIAFYIEPEDEGFERNPIRTMGQWAGAYAEYHLDDVKVPDSRRIFDRDGLYPITMYNTLARLQFAGFASGIMEKMTEKLIDSISQRERGGKKLTEHFHIKAEIGEMVSNLHSTRQAVYAELRKWRQLDEPSLDQLGGNAHPDAVATRSLIDQAITMVRMHGAAGYRESEPWAGHLRSVMGSFCGLAPEDKLLSQLGEKAVTERRFARLGNQAVNERQFKS